MYNDDATYRQRMLRKGGHRKMGPDGKLHAANERWKFDKAFD